MSHCSQWDFVHTCVEVRAVIELSVGEVSGVGHSMGVVDGGPCAPSGMGSFEDLASPFTPLV